MLAFLVSCVILYRVVTDGTEHTPLDVIAYVRNTVCATDRMYKIIHTMDACGWHVLVVLI